MEDDSEGGTFVESCGQRYHVMVLKDFRKFRSLAMDPEGWTTHYSDAMITVQTKPPPGGNGGGLNIVRVRREMKNVPTHVLYDNLHDAEYRKTWDANMLAGHNICELNRHNDIGYYGAKFPWPLANRDFCNMRSWMEFTNGEFLIFNHSVPHNDCPEKKGFVRAKSIVTGYYVQPMPNNPGGCILIYVTHTDLGGSIPHGVINYAMQKGVPGIMNKMEDCAQKYIQFAKERYPPGHVQPWHTPKMDWDSSEDYPGATPPSALNPHASKQIVPTPAAALLAGNSAPTTDLVIATTSASHATAGSSSSSGEVEALRAELSEVQRKLFLAMQSGGGVGGGVLSLASVAPAQEGDSKAIQQYRALMQDTLNTIDRMYVQEGRIPTTREYLTRVHYVLEGLRKTIPAQ